MKILIIGSRGYIGSALMGYFDSQAEGIDIVDGIDYGDLTREDLKYYTDIILLAGNSSVQSCVGNPLNSLNNNVVKFLNLLNIIDGQRLIYASSSSVYGNTKDKLATEDDLTFLPTTNYDLTKYIIDCYARLSNIEYYGLRFGTVNGKSVYSNVVRSDIMINAMVKNAIENNTINVINPHVNRPILDINDLIKAVDCILTGMRDMRGIYNLASYNVTVGDAANMVHIMTKADQNTVCNDATTYDFSIDIGKFISAYPHSRFNCRGIYDTISSLIYGFDKIKFTKGS